MSHIAVTDAAPVPRAKSDIVRKLDPRVVGDGARQIMFAHGFGCDQDMWRYVAPAFQNEFQTMLFDDVGAGGSGLSAYDAKTYASLDGSADDVALAEALKVSVAPDHLARVEAYGSSSVQRSKGVTKIAYGHAVPVRGTVARNTRADRNIVELLRQRRSGPPH